MTVTAATLKARFVEFAPVADSVVSAAIAEATHRTDVRVFGNRFDDAVSLRACDLLSTGAFGQQARVDPKAATVGGITLKTNMFSTVKIAFEVAVMRDASVPGWRSEKKVGFGFV